MTAARARDYVAPIDKHFHTLEIVIIASLGVPVLWHFYRAIGGKMAHSRFPALAKLGAAGAGVFTFGTGA